MSDIWNELRPKFESLQRPFPSEAVDKACVYREEVAPQLVAALEAMAADPQDAADSDTMIHLYAMQLLAHWRDRRGFRPLLALGGLHDKELVEELFGDHMTESFGRCLASMSGGELAPMMALAEDERAYVWARAGALEGMKICVVEGDADRTAVMAFVASLCEREAAAVRGGRVPEYFDLELLDSLVAVATDLGAVDMLPAIRRWFDEGLLDESFADIEFVEANISQPWEACLRRMRGSRDRYIGEPAKEMAWWACFNEDEGDVFEGGDMGWEPVPEPYVRAQPKTGRNDPCPCGSGKKFKKCHGAG